MVNHLSMAELMKHLPEELINGNADASVHEEDNGQVEEKVEVQVENEAEETSQETVLDYDHTEIDQGVDSKPKLKRGPWVSKMMELEQVVLKYKEIVDHQQDQIDFIRGRTDRIMEENSAIKRQLSKQSTEVIQRNYDRLKQQLEVLANKVNRR